jgi:C-terminal processing protease CtpA/Prc
MLVGVGPLLGEGTLGAAVYPDGERREIWYSEGKGGFGDYVQLRVTEPPHALRDPEAPLAILIDATTASSAEVLVAAARGRLNTRTFGTATRGANSGNRNFDLSDGATLVLAVALTSDRQGELLSGEIEPDEYVAPRRRTERDGPTGDLTLSAAAAWLAGQPACAAP